MRSQSWCAHSKVHAAGAYLFKYARQGVRVACARPGVRVDTASLESYGIFMDMHAENCVRLTDAARLALDNLLGAQPRPELRVFLSFLHTSGPRLDIAPDAASAEDAVFDLGGWRLVISALLLSQAAPITVDCGPGGFVIHSSLDFSEAGGNCGGACNGHH